MFACFRVYWLEIFLRFVCLLTCSCSFLLASIHLDCLRSPCLLPLHLAGIHSLWLFPFILAFSHLFLLVPIYFCSLSINVCSVLSCLLPFILAYTSNLLSLFQTLFAIASLFCCFRFATVSAMNLHASLLPLVANIPECLLVSCFRCSKHSYHLLALLPSRVRSYLLVASTPKVCPCYHAHSFLRSHLFMLSFHASLFTSILPLFLPALFLFSCFPTWKRRSIILTYFPPPRCAHF